MKNRIKYLREEILKISQKEFGEKIGVQQAAVNKYECGLSKPSESAIQLICIKFDVNEKWLRDGELPIIKEMTEIEEMKKIIDDVMESKNEFQRNALYVLATMTPEEWDIVEQFYYKIKKHSKDKTDL